jgi:hypothetical protein
MKIVELTTNFLKGLEKRSMEPVMLVIGVLFPIGDKFKNICSGSIYSMLCEHFCNEGGYYAGIRKYWSRIIQSTNETISFNTLYLSLKPLKTVCYSCLYGFFYIFDFFEGCEIL